MAQVSAHAVKVCSASAPPHRTGSRGAAARVAWRGVAWRGVAWPGVAWRGVAWARYGAVRLWDESGGAPHPPSPVRSSPGANWGQAVSPCTRLPSRWPPRRRTTETTEDPLRWGSLFVPLMTRPAILPKEDGRLGLRAVEPRQGTRSSRRDSLRQRARWRWGASGCGWHECSEVPRNTRHATRRAWGSSCETPARARAGRCQPQGSP